ncbi:hypothetical protein [Marinitoga sp. 38H-ov]|uniref:hypothetical protein n=1 Tax=Marinitoga sp. 38H-ov TaxID=1755814 RepID=UPI0013EDAAE3|nr:hypothetical protein [Marinitoga sp. 38H-ov]KAF2955666.1 hypothetical protein AS160_00705 [Marinitoga sp. 38H-ov]
MGKIKQFLILMLFIPVYTLTNNIFINFDYYNNNLSNIYLGYDLEFLKIKIGSQHDFQFSGGISIPFYYNNYVIEPYYNYSSFNSLGIKLGYKNFSIKYNYSKKNGSIYGIDFEMPIIKFGKDEIAFLESKDNIKVIAGERLLIKLIARTRNNRPAQNIDLFYTLNDSDMIYMGKTNMYGEAWFSNNITKSGNYIVNIYSNRKLIKKIKLEVIPSFPNNITFDFDKDKIYTNEENLIKIKNIKVYDKYNNEIKNFNMKFFEFNFVGNIKDINFSYLDNTLLIEPFDKSGVYEIYYKAEINKKIIYGIKKIKVENNPKNIADIRVYINYIGKDSNYAIFKIEKPKIIFLNSEIIQAEKYFVYSNNERVEVKNGIFKIPLDKIPEKFIVDVYYNNYLKTIIVHN